MGLGNCQSLLAFLLSQGCAKVPGYHPTPSMGRGAGMTQPSCSALWHTASKDRFHGCHATLGTCESWTSPDALELMFLSLGSLDRHHPSPPRDTALDESANLTPHWASPWTSQFLEILPYSLSLTSNTFPLIYKLGPFLPSFEKLRLFKKVLCSGNFGCYLRGEGRIWLKGNIKSLATSWSKEKGKIKVEYWPKIFK